LTARVEFCRAWRSPVVEPDVKASKGVEKSFRQRKTRRGQRKGKSRVRGRQPRTNSHPTLESKESRSRPMMRHLRACDHWYGRQELLCEKFKESKLFRDMRSSSGEDFSDESYVYWRLRWSKLRRHIVPFGEGVVWCSRIGPSFLYWLEQRFKIIVRRYNRNPASSSRSLRDLADELRIRNDNFVRRGTGNRSLPLRFLFVCAFCKGRRSWAAPMKVSRCPTCSRPAYGTNGNQKKPTRKR
jgi:hypothetical protein